VSKETTINASARMVHIEINGDEAFVASVAGAVSGIINRLINREPETPVAPKKAATKRAAKKAATGSTPRTVRVTKGAR
jgi:hypothetical protein